MKPEAVQAPEGRRDFAPASSVWDDLKVLRAMWLATGHSVKGLEHQVLPPIPAPTSLVFALARFWPTDSPASLEVSTFS